MLSLMQYHHGSEISIYSTSIEFQPVVATSVISQLSRFSLNDLRCNFSLLYQNKGVQQEWNRKGEGRVFGEKFIIKLLPNFHLLNYLFIDSI